MMILVLIATMPVMAVAGGRRHLVYLPATPPSAGRQQPPGQDSGVPSSPDENTIINMLLFIIATLVFIGVCSYVHRCHREEQEQQQDTSRGRRGPRNNNGGEGGRAPPWRQRRQQQPANRDGRGPRSNSGEGGSGRAPRRQRQQQPAGTPAVDVDVVLAPAPVLVCTFQTADGWVEKMCSVCLADLADGETVRVLPACMHYFHPACVNECLRARHMPALSRPHRS